MINIASLKETRASKMTAIKALTANANYDTAQFDTLESEIGVLNKQIRNAETLAEFERQADAGTDTRLESETREFSVAKAIKESVAGKLTGREAEVSAELGKGREVRGVMVPTSLIFGEQRSMLTSGSSGNTVATNLGSLIDRLRPVLAVQGLGATVIPGLVGNLDLPRLTGGPTAHWVSEDSPSTASDSTFDKVSLAPKTVTGEMYMSRRLTLQSGVAIENILRSDLAFVLAQALDSAAIKGGGSNEPEGILSLITEFSDDESHLSDTAADLISALEIDDVTGSTGFLTNPTLLGVARKIKDLQDRTIPLSDIFHQERVVSSNNVPSDANSPAKQPLIFGAWSNLVLGYWSGVDILANPYSDASKGGLRLHAFLDADVAVRHEEAFSWKAV